MPNKLNSIIQMLLLLLEDEEDDYLLILMILLLDKRRKETSNELPSSKNEIKVFCPKCNTEVSHTAKGMQEDQTKILVAKVYHYFEQEYEELKKMYVDLDLTPLSKFRQRTALATGVSETTILQILKEEEGRNAEKRREPPRKRRAARKRRRQTDSSSGEDSCGDSVEDIEQPSDPDNTFYVKIEPSEDNNEEPGILLTEEIKIEPNDGEISIEEPEIFMPPVKVELSDSDTNKEQTDPISLDVKTEPDDEVDTSPQFGASGLKKEEKKCTLIFEEVED